MDGSGVVFKERKEVNLSNISNSVKDQNALVFHYSEDKDFNALYEFAIIEQVKKNKTVFAIFIVQLQYVILQLYPACTCLF